MYIKERDARGNANSPCGFGNILAINGEPTSFPMSAFETKLAHLELFAGKSS